MPYTYNGIIYNRLSSVPTFEKAMAACKAGDVVPVDAGVWQQQARIDIMAHMHLWTDLKVDNANVFPAIKRILLGNVPGGSYSHGDICNRVLASVEHGPNREEGIKYNLYHAIGYLCNGMDSTIFRGNDVRNFIDQVAEQARTPSTYVECLHCEETCEFSEFVGFRIISHGAELIRHNHGRRFLCDDCCENAFVFSPLMRQYLLDDGGLEYPEFLNGGAVTRAYAEANFDYDEENEEYIERGASPRQSLLGYSANPFTYNEWDSRNANNALVFGVELEMEPRNCSGRDLITKLGGSDQRGKNFILKHDGSLQDGVELVTMPFTLEQHKEEKAIRWKKLLTSVAGKAMSGAHTDRCGMHIHINKAALSALTIGKMLVFLNSEDLAPLITTIAQRGSGHYCERDTKKITDGVKTSDNRYDIMNVSGSHPTCEIRMFRGNLKVERVYKNIEFCHALVQYARQTGMQDLQDWGNFSRWLISKRGQYPFLVQFLIDKRSMGFTQLAQASNEHYTYPMVEEA